MAFFFENLLPVHFQLISSTGLPNDKWSAATGDAQRIGRAVSKKPLKTLISASATRLQKLSKRLPVLGESPYLCRPKSVFADSFPATAGTVQWDKPNLKK